MSQSQNKANTRNLFTPNPIKSLYAERLKIHREMKEIERALDGNEWAAGFISLKETPRRVSKLDKLKEKKDNLDRQIELYNKNVSKKEDLVMLKSALAVGAVVVGGILIDTYMKDGIGLFGSMNSSLALGFGISLVLATAALLLSAYKDQTKINEHKHNLQKQIELRPII